MRKLRTLDLFTGIGGFTIGLDWTGMFKAVAFSEIDPYCNRRLALRYPSVPNLGDIKDVTKQSFLDHHVGPVDVVTAGFPCQPFSLAGSRNGMADERWLWGHIFRVIRMVRPKYIILENVPALISSDGGAAIRRILGDLAEI